MASLDPVLRSALEKAVVIARQEAEDAAGVALKILAVDRSEAFATHSEPQRRLRNALRARARQLGGGNQTTGFRLLVEEVAYEQWHRMLFARFLAENNLLMHPSGVAVTLEDCGELAPEEGEANRWQMAARYASHMLPGIFRTEDPSVQVPFTPEGREALERILAKLPLAVFTSEDGLGWVYQFWQSKRKKEVSQSGRKIERLDLAAYSQLFTEHYMVRFLLENSLGAWWAARHPDSPLIKEFTYLRYRDDGTPAAGTFPGWPKRAAEVTVMDPCCGSGHFLVAAFEMLRRMRMEEEGLSEAEAADVVLRDNLFGLEIDPRCVQIAAFALALAAWKTGGYRLLPLPNVACSGIPVTGQLEEWTKLAGDDVNLKHTLERLYYLFSNAPDLGSLLNPMDVPVQDRMFEPDLAKVAGAMERALAKERIKDPVALVFGEAALGIARATGLLAGQYTLIATNVPYLGRRHHGESLRNYVEARYPDAKADLATVFVERCRAFVTKGGTYALVTPQNWLFLGSYKKLRRSKLQTERWAIICRLGPGAFQTITGEVVNVAFVIIDAAEPEPNNGVLILDVASHDFPSEKAHALIEIDELRRDQSAILGAPDSRVFAEAANGLLLEHYADSLQGISTGDNPRFSRKFWEAPQLMPGWRFLQASTPKPADFAGREHVVHLAAIESDGVALGAALRGKQAWGKSGICINRMGDLYYTTYLGDIFDINIAVILPRQQDYLPAIRAFCRSQEFARAVRRLDMKPGVTNATLGKVSFDLEHWQKVADETDPLPEPYSNDPMQWLFGGDPLESTEPLQVAVARLLGYRWPEQDPDRLSLLADPDGILPLSPIAGEEPATERLRAVLAVAYGEAWSSNLQEQLLQQVGYGGKGLEGWLRDGFFEQHCKLFHQRPFIWHIWDGRRDGFTALVNYHKVDAGLLDKLIYTYLGDWIRTQRAARDGGTPGADARLVAALELQKKLEAIRDGEPPHDIYVRWKPLHQQPIGWNPDLNDGVRLNIRPFVTAGVLRSRVNVNWNKDRGLNPDGSERINDVHLTVAQKRASREAAVV